MQQGIHYENAHWFVTSKLIPSWTALAAMDRFSEAERRLLLCIPNAVALLPHVDEKLATSVEIDLYWEDKNWLGRLSYQAGKLELWSNLCQEEGCPRELYGQWQHTALMISVDKGLETHDPAHLWFWTDCFGRFVSACQVPGSLSHGRLVLTSGDSVLEIDTAHFNHKKADEP